MSNFSVKETKKIIKTILNYRATNIGKPQERPFAIVGPDGGSSCLRIYCYGGAAGSIEAEIDITDNKYPVKSSLADEGYERFLRRYYADGNNTVYSLPKEMLSKDKKKFPIQYSDILDEVPYITKAEKEKYSFDKIVYNPENPPKTFDKKINMAPYIPGLDEDYLIELSKGTDNLYAEILALNHNQRHKYLDYIIAAMSNKYVNETGGDGDKNLGERRVQTGIIKKYMKIPFNQDVCIAFDMEFEIRVGKGASKPDIVVFDGLHFGLVELKYAGQSMEEKNIKNKDGEKKKGNSLTDHYNDFYQVIYSGDIDTKAIAEECLRRIKFLLKYGLIDSTWEEAVKHMEKRIKNSERASDLFWMGFLFVEGNGNSKKDNVDFVLKQMEQQLYDKIISDTDVNIRYKYTKQNDIDFSFNDGRSEILKLIEPLHENRHKADNN